MKNGPVRMCVACKKRDNKYKLLRFVEKDGILYFDPDYKAPGRGVSICPNAKCFRQAFKKRLFDRALKTELSLPDSPEVLIDEVKRVLKERIVNAVRIGIKFKGVFAGHDAVKSKMRNKKVKLVILARDLSERSKSDFYDPDVEVHELFTKNEWGEFLGRKPVGIIGVVDEGLARKLSLLIEKYASLETGGN